MSVVGDGGKDGDEDRSNSAGAGGDLQDICSDGADVWERYMGGDRGHVKSIIGIPSLGIQKDYGHDGSACNGRRMGMAPGGRSARDYRALSNKGIHPAEVGHHCGVGGLPAHT